ncbi:DUF748 domain-containing protein [Desulfoplanes sp.]
MGMILTTWKGFHWTLKTFVILTTLFVLYTVLGFLALPPIAKSVLTDKLGQALSRRVVIDTIRFNPLTLQAQVQGVAVYGADNSTVDLSLDGLDVDVQSSSVVRGALVLKRVFIRTPVVSIHVLDASGQTNLTDMFVSGGKEGPKPAEQSDGTRLFPVIIEDFACTNGTLRVQDDPRDVTHVIDRIGLAVPYFSTHQKDLGTKILPRLAFRLNKTPFEIQGSSIPFSSPRRTEFDLTEAGLDLTPFRKYVPLGPHLTLVSGRVTSNASLVVEESDTGDHPLNLFLAGRFQLDDAMVDHRQDGTVLACKKMVAELERFSLVRREIAFSSIRIKAPFGSIIREDGDAINWNRYIRGMSGDTAARGNGSNATAAPPMLVTAASILVENGRVECRDTVVDQGFETAISPLNIEIKNLDTRAGAVSNVRVDMGTSHGETLALKADVVLTPFGCNGTCRLTNATIPTYTPYYAAYLPLELYQGGLGAVSGFEIATGNATDVRLNDLALSLTGMKLRKPGDQKPCIGLDTLALGQGNIDMTARRIAFANATLEAPFVSVERDKKGNIDLVSLFSDTGKDGTPVADGPNSSVGQSKPWMVGIDHVRCVDGQAGFTDYAARQRAVNRIGGLDIDLDNVGSDLARAVDFSLTAVVNDSGKIRARGKMIPETRLTTGRLDVAGLGLTPLNPYLPDPLGIDVAAGFLDISGNWDLTAQKEIAGRVSGDVRIADFLLNEPGNKKKLAGFTSLALEGIDLGLDPRVLKMDGIVLTGPDMVLAKDEQGVLNLARALGAGGDKEENASSAGATAKSPATAPNNATGTDTEKHPYFFRDIDIGRVQIVQGNVGFYDHSLSPDFSADLGRIHLDLRRVSLDPSKRAELNLNATLNDHAPISLAGDISPLRRPVASSLVFNLSHLDMTSLTPYTLRSLAYPVLHGKLNWNGKFRTEEYVLDATNTFFIQQFELGDKVESPDAVSVPIKLGLALLQDGDGDLTLDVPVQGRLDDPNFRLGGVIFKAIVGIFSKIATAPFALIGSMFGGGPDLSHLAYAPGQALIEPESGKKLDTVVTALTKRPGLRVFVAGLVDPVKDRSALENKAFMRMLKVQKYDADKDVVPGVEAVTIAPDEYATWLFEAYKATPGEKPRKFGKVVRPSPEEMEGVVRQEISVKEDDLLDLANRRARGVQQYLLEKGNIAADRVFVTSSKTAQGEDEQSGMRVELSLGK